MTVVGEGAKRKKLFLLEADVMAVGDSCPFMGDFLDHSVGYAGAL